jgi:hypothetical protein
MYSAKYSAATTDPKRPASCRPFRCEHARQIVWTTAAALAVTRDQVGNAKKNVEQRAEL